MARRRGPAHTPPVHPHGRGDNGQGGCSARGVIGSPPRAWGQSRRPAGARRECRFTPTGVGTMGCTVFLLPLSAVHPHGRGDNDPEPTLEDVFVGSPPRAWGQCRIRRRAHRASRFTPTGVGTIRWLKRNSSSATVHPHGRGDNLIRDLLRRPEAGSPPRAWGQL